MTFLVIVAVISVLFAAYVVWGRPWMREKPWAKPFFVLIEPIEIALWWKSETVLKARAKMLLGVMLTFLTQLGTLDITPLMPLVPAAWEPIVKIVFNLLPMILTVGGWVDEKLRHDTTKPLELVAVANKDKTPAVTEALAVADVAKVAAVETVASSEAAKTLKAE